MKQMTWLVVVVVLGLTTSACGNSEGANSGGASSGGAAANGESAGDNAANQPAVFANHQTQLDLLQLAHLADVDHHGLYIDFGTPARRKYTLGNWKASWISDRTAGTTTFTNMGSKGRVYFNVDAAGPVTLRFRAKSLVSRSVLLFLNGNHALESLRLDAPGGDFKDYDIHVPAELVAVGENQLLIRAGVESDTQAQIALDSLRVIPGEDANDGGSFSPPVQRELTTEMRVGNVQRRALAVRAPTTLSWYVEVPRGGKLGFGIGAEGSISSNANAKVYVTADGAQRTQVFSHGIGARWHDALVPLDRWAGQVVRVELVAEGATGPARIGWSTPSVLVPTPAAVTAPPARNVVVLLIDTQRADHIHAWNPQTRVRTPSLDRFAQEGALFEAAQSPENWTKPSVASVLTSLYPMTHGAKTDDARLPAAAVMLSEVYKEAGFSTASFIANGYVSDRFGFDQGWDHYTNYIRENRDTRASTLFHDAGDWIEQHKNERFFVYVQTIDPHVPYDPPDEYLRQYDSSEYGGQVTPRQTADLLEKAKKNPPEVVFNEADRTRLEALYDGEVAYHDHEFGDFVARLRSLGVYDNTLFVVTSDHGEELHDHGSWGHGHTVYQELLHVPLAFRYPAGIRAGQRLPETVSTVDIGPTILEMTGVPVHQSAEGQSLRPDLRGEVPPGPSVAFSDFLDDRRVIRAGRWKLIMRGTNSTFFDLQQDPGELHEIDGAAHPIAIRYCRIMLGQFLGASDRRRWIDADQNPRGNELHQENAEIDPTLRGQLQALGYAGGSEGARACTTNADCVSPRTCREGQCRQPGAAAPAPRAP